MVQSSRLKNHIHPLVPIISVLFLISAFLFVYSKPLQEKLFNSYGSYKGERNVLIDQYNQYKEEITLLLTQPYSKITDYRLNLTKALATNDKSRSVLKNIKDLDSKAIKKYEDKEIDINEDSELIANNELLTTLINNKISAIDVYQTILNFDDCLRNAKSNSDVSNCREIYSNIKAPANVTTEYKNMVERILSSFFSYTKIERTSMINKLVPHHNKMINTLEVIINSPITL